MRPVFCGAVFRPTKTAHAPLRVHVSRDRLPTVPGVSALGAYGPVVFAALPGQLQPLYSETDRLSNRLKLTRQRALSSISYRVKVIPR